MSASIGLSAASEKSREFPAFSTGRGNAFCLRHVGDARHVGDGGYSPCLFGYVTMWVGASQSDAHQPIRTSVNETKEAVYRPMRGASWDEEQTSKIIAARKHLALAGCKPEGAVCICNTINFSTKVFIINEYCETRNAKSYYFVYRCVSIYLST